MSDKTRTKDNMDAWFTKTDEPPEPGYEEALQAAIAEGIVDADAGRVTSLEDVRKEFGLDE